MTPGRLAWGLFGLAVVLVVPGPVLQTALEWKDEADLVFLLAFVALQLGTAGAGAVIASRLPRNPVGWCFLAMGVGMAVAISSGVYAELGLDSTHGPLPADEVAAWFSSWIFIPVIFGVPLYLLLVFPDGRFLSPRWRWVGFGLAAIVALASVALAFKPGEIEPLGVQNRLAFGGKAGELMTALDSITNLLALPGFGLAVAGLVVRFRRSRGVERQQLKWFTYVAAFVGIGLAGSILVPGGWPADLLFFIGLAALAGLPVAAAIAILRYRLYDIDVVINRTLVYGALTATLAAAYLGSVLLLQLALSPLTEDSGLAVAGSTLAVAALFRPARTRIQGAVDRRFYRRRYDAARTLAGFGARLRDQVDLDSLSAELRTVVADTMQPAHVSLWMRGSEAGR
jgi:hypothetical protein